MSRSSLFEGLDERVRTAVRHYWLTRRAQSRDQISRGAGDQGARSAVTAGKQMDGFVGLVRDVLIESGIPAEKIHYNSKLELPGYYRPEKQWDLVVVSKGRLVAVIEFKSQASSFGNNFNNRVEECVGSATDLWTAYREGAVPTTPRPWLGYLMLLVDCEESTRPVRVREPHFSVLPEFERASYVQRYRLLLTKLMRENLYTAACLLTTPRPDASMAGSGEYAEPDADLSMRHLLASLHAQATQTQAVEHP